MESELNTIEPRRVGLLGGTFNPLHLGHLIMAQDAMERYDLDEVCLIPCASPPHKQDHSIAPARHRLAMIESALEDNCRISCSVVELERGGVSYTIDTVFELKKRYPQTEFYFIIGGDTLFELYTWKEIDKLLQVCFFLTVARPRFDFEEINVEKLRLSEQQVERLKGHVMVGHQVDISSTGIRACIAEGLSIRYLVPDKVVMYIAEHNLYKVTQ